VGRSFHHFAFSTCRGSGFRSGARLPNTLETGAADGSGQVGIRMGIFAVFGLVFGSFLTVVIHRSPRHESMLAARSRCPECGATVGARDNIPLISYLLLRGRCRACDHRISAEYPLTELAAAGLFVASAIAHKDDFVAGLVGVFLGLVLAAAVVDARHRVIPNAIVYPGLVVFAAALVVGAVLGRDLSLGGAALGLLLYGGSLFVVALAVPKGMGMGDVKLAALIGMVIGSRGVPSVAVAIGAGILAGGLGSVVALAAGRSRKSAMPFGPFLVAGAVAAAFVGPWAAGTYANLLR
jgi:leader peptidase (prepilin peptidase) / N-methyltransferase